MGFLLQSATHHLNTIESSALSKGSLIFPDDSFMSFLLQSATHHLNTIESSALSSSTAPGVSLLLKPMSKGVVRTQNSSIPLSPVWTIGWFNSCDDLSAPHNRDEKCQSQDHW